MKGQSIRSINVENLTAITDYMVIVTGTSSTHIRALADSVVVKLREAKHKVAGVEGKMQSEWVLVDAGGVVVHIMMAPMRALYNLEDLWDFKGRKDDQQNADREIMHSVVAERKPVSNKRSAAKIRRTSAAKKTRSTKPGSTKPGSTKPGSAKPRPTKSSSTRSSAPKKAVSARSGKRDGGKSS